MAAKKRSQHRAEFKAKMALEAYRDHKTVNQIASNHELVAVQVIQWKSKLIQDAVGVFGRTTPQPLGWI
ncbi:MAG: hypothetical protein P8176_14600 [Gammaproteobacteria bacterium]